MRLPFPAVLSDFPALKSSAILFLSPTARNLSRREGLPRRLANRRLAILSNGSPGMLCAVLDSNGLTDRFERVPSVYTLKLYKPHPAVYQQVADQLKVPKESIGFVSSNFWDAGGVPLLSVFRPSGSNAPNSPPTTGCHANGHTGTANTGRRGSVGRRPRHAVNYDGTAQKTPRPGL
jgi:hypothetical protein